MRSFISCASALAVIIATSASPAMAATTFIDQSAAEAASADTLGAMQDACDLLAAAHDTANGDIWSGVATAGTATLKSGPTEAGGTRVIDLTTVVGIGFHASHTEIQGAIYRTGGSVNLFGDQFATAGYYDASTYDFDADFESTYSHAFSCAISQEVYHAPVFVPGHPVEGYYTNNGTIPSQGEGSCQGLSPANPHWGSDLGNCTWHETGPAVDDDYTEETWDPAVLVTTEFGSIDQDQTENLRAHEDAGSGYEETGAHFLGKVVVCNSPSKTGPKGNPGTWTAQNGYSGANCNTTYFNSAPWGSGSQTSNGTYISVPPAV